MLISCLLPKGNSLRANCYNTKIKHDSNNELFAASRWSLLGPDLLCQFSGSLWFLFCRWQSDSCKPFDDAVNPDAGPWLHLPCHSHPLQSLFLVFKVFWRSLVAWRILTNAAADSAAFARYQCGLFIWWVFKVNPRQWIPLLCFVPGPEHPILSAGFSVGFAWLDNFGFVGVSCSSSWDFHYCGVFLGFL